jgi:prolyl-tRNA synthetase
MRWSHYFLYTLREVPADADVISQKLMMRGGMIRKVAAGIYTYLPLGVRSLHKLEAIVRDEMNRADGRGSHHRHRARHDQLVPPVTGQPLPDPDEVP